MYILVNLPTKYNDSIITIYAENKYESDINAFAIELFGLHSEKDDRLIYRLLFTAFETFSDRDYCIIVVPTMCRTFPFLQQFVVFFFLSSRIIKITFNYLTVF